MRSLIAALLSAVVLAGTVCAVTPPKNTDPEPPRQEEARRRPEDRNHAHPPALPLRKHVLEGKWMYIPEHGWVYVPRVQPFPPPLPKPPSMEDLKKYIEWRRWQHENRHWLPIPPFELPPGVPLPGPHPIPPPGHPANPPATPRQPGLPPPQPSIPPMPPAND